ncbi:MAG TPA: sortase [Actinomycetota bacterium]|nr:sortase [Actinomycetota bacterium]
MSIPPAPAEEAAAGNAEHKPERKKREPRRAKRPTGKATVIIAVLASIAGLALWFEFYSLVLTPFQEHGNQVRLYDAFRLQLAEATAPTGGAIASGAPVALIDAPGMHDLVVVEGTTSANLMQGPGHERDTPLPGQQGTSVIDGRSVTFGAPFRSLSHLAAGDVMDVTTSQGQFVFRVDRVRGPGDPAPAPASDAAGLTLVTAASSGWRSGWAPDHAMFVDATLTGAEPVTTPAGRPTTIAENERLMAGDDTARLVGLFWLEAIGLVAAGILWARRRWGPWQTWIVGVPLAVAVLWGASGILSRLLPNLI